MSDRILGAALLALAACGGPRYGIDRSGDDLSGDLPIDVGEDSAQLPVDAGRDVRSSAPEPDASDARDAGEVDAPVDASSAAQTFTIGATDCGGGHCNGGYNGVKDATKHLQTATKQCTDRAFARATDFDIGGQPGGRFCDFNGTSYACDSSCDGCNIITAVTCVKP
jgi:hypothetical protein